MQSQKIIDRALEIRKLFSKYERKNTGNEWTNLQLMEGFVVDIGDLMKLIMAKEGLRKVDDIDKKLAHELSDCLWSIIVLSEKYNINLEKSFFKTMYELEKKLE